MNKTGKANTIAAVCIVLFACSPTTQWEEGDGYRSRPLNIPKRGHSGFSLLTPRETRITFENNVSEQQALENEHVFNGSGVAAGDVDGDGLVDLYFARLDGPNVLYRNRGGLRFEDVTESAGVAAPDRLSTGAMFIDVDGDADLDLLTTSMGGPTSLFVNDGTGVFTDATDGSGLASGFYGTTMTSADVDGDGDLDLYVANNKLKAVRDIYPPDARCQGLMISQTCEDLEDPSSQISISAWRCFNCGEVVDPLILNNRWSPPEPIIGRARLNTPLSRLKLRELAKREKPSLTTAPVGT